MKETVYNSDLSAANRDFVEHLHNLSSGLSNISSSIENFNSNSVNELTGSGYDAVRSKLSIYSSICDNMSNILDGLTSVIASVNNKVSNSMESKPEVSYSNRIIQELENKIDKIRFYDYLRLTGTETDNELQQKYREAQHTYLEIKNELLKLLKLLKNVKSSVESGSSELGNNNSFINRTKTEVASINVSSFN